MSYPALPLSRHLSNEGKLREVISDGHDFVLEKIAMTSLVFASGEVREILVRRTGKKQRLTNVFDFIKIQFQKLYPPSE